MVLVETYPFRWAGVDYDVTTHYFGASLEDEFDPKLSHVVDAAYNLGACWLPTDEAIATMSVHPAIASAVARILALASRTPPQSG